MLWFLRREMMIDFRLSAWVASKKSGVIKRTGGEATAEERFQQVCVDCVCVQLCLTLWDSVHGILQARVLECHFLSQGLNPSPMCLLHWRRIPYHWATREAPGLCKTANGWREAKCSMERVTAWNMGQWDTALEKAEYALKNLGEMAWKRQVGRGSNTGSWRGQNPFPSARWTDSPAHLPPRRHTATPGNKCFSLHPSLTLSRGVPLMEWLCNSRTKPPPPPALALGAPAWSSAVRL